MTAHRSLYRKKMFTMIPYLSLGRGFCVVVVTSLFVVQSACAGRIKSKDPLVDVRIVVDISASMQQFGPNNTRRSLVASLGELLPEDSRAGVWTFGKYVNMLVPLGQVDANWRDTLIQKVPEIQSIADKSNLPEALRQATYGWSRPSTVSQRSLILLSDGKVDAFDSVRKNNRAQRKILKSVLPKLIKAGVKIHVVAVPDAADMQFLQTLVYKSGGSLSLLKPLDEETDDIALDSSIAVAGRGDAGQQETAQNLQQTKQSLTHILSPLFDASVPLRQQVSLKNNQFYIDSQVSEFVLWVNKSSVSAPTELQAPDGQIVKSEKNQPRLVSENTSTSQQPLALRWMKAPDMDLVRVSQPQAGIWKLNADLHPENRVVVESALNLKSDSLPNHIIAGEAPKVGFSFVSADDSNKENPASLSDFAITVLQKVLQKDPQEESEWHAQVQPTDAAPEYYVVAMQGAEVAGNQTLRVEMRSEGISRFVEHPVKVLEPTFAAQFSVPPVESLSQVQLGKAQLIELSSSDDFAIPVIVEPATAGLGIIGDSSETANSAIDSSEVGNPKIDDPEIAKPTSSVELPTEHSILPVSVDSVSTDESSVSVSVDNGLPVKAVVELPDSGHSTTMASKTASKVGEVELSQVNSQANPASKAFVPQISEANSTVEFSNETTERGLKEEVQSLVIELEPEVHQVQAYQEPAGSQSQLQKAGDGEALTSVSKIQQNSSSTVSAPIKTQFSGLSIYVKAGVFVFLNLLLFCLGFGIYRILKSRQAAADRELDEQMRKVIYKRSLISSSLKERIRPKPDYVSGVELVPVDLERIKATKLSDHDKFEALEAAIKHRKEKLLQND